MKAKQIAGATNRYIIHDTMEAFLVDLETGKPYFFGWTTEANITRAVSTEDIKAGIYNKVVAVLSVDDGMTFSIKTGVHYEDVMEIQMGSEFEDIESTTVQTIKEERDGTFTAEERQVSGQVMDLSANKLPKNYQVQLRSIAYDPETNVEVSDIYWIFDKATPDGNLNEIFNAGGNKTQDITFKAQTPIGSNSYGKYIIAPKKLNEEKTDTEKEDKGKEDDLSSK